MSMQVPVLETERLVLRAHRIDDYDTCLAIWSDPEVTRYIGGVPFTSEQVWDRMLRYAGMWGLLGYGYWAVEEKDSGRYIGDIGHADLKRDIAPSLQGMLEFGWALAPHAHGKGYTGEAVAAVTAWGQENFSHLRAVCIISPENVPSIRVAEKAGFREWQRTVYHGKPTIVFAR
ncbi:GNAT family N-acetyltransferase [Dyella subtropica]|uniref:GNAT family N-acetyltransferase n=1 Tax=Dyella subtropica TaxID=2992127 RepID=UPI002259F59B|nr:GNAT family N-acetyltransferase [Dyella subtropica]